MRYGKSYGQWFKEVEWYIRELGLSEQYANAQAICVRSLYGDKYHFADTKYAAKYALRNTNTAAIKSKTIKSECRKINKSRGKFK